MGKMIRYIYLLLLSVIPIRINAQEVVECNATVFIGMDYGRAIYVYPDAFATPGTELFAVRNNLDEEWYVSLRIKGRTPNMFFCDFFDMAGDCCYIGEGWIRKEHLSVLLRFPYQHHEFKLYKTPNSSGGITCCINDSEEYVVTVVDAMGSWLKVKVENGENVNVGWLAPENQCSDLYSACCGE